MGRSRPDLGGQLQEQSTPAPRSLPQPTPRPFSPSLQKCLPETLWRVWAWGQEPVSLNGSAINLSLLPALMLRWFDLLCRAHEFVFSNKTQIFTPLLKNSPWLLMSRLIKTKRLNEACEGPPPSSSPVCRPVPNSTCPALLCPWVCPRPTLLLSHARSQGAQTPAYVLFIFIPAWAAAHNTSAWFGEGTKRRAHRKDIY